MPRRNLYAVALVALVWVLCRQATQAAKPKDEMMEMYGLFVDAVEQVETNYVRPVSRRELLESALNGMLHNLDPHSSFINTSEWKQFRRQIEGRFGGIGIQVGFDPDFSRLKVMAPMVGTPAYDAGILAGDIILEIDGQTTEGMTIEKAIEVLQGGPGTPVKLTVLHEGSNSPETLTMNRAIIDVPSVLGDHRKPDDHWDFMLDRDKKIGYIRISSFIQNTTQELKAALDELRQEGMKGLVLDLRDDPGGLLSAAVEVSDLFLEDGKIVSTKGRNSPERIFSAHKDGTYTDFPMVVMVNESTASAAEIVSAALQDHKRAAIVGQRSFGKGSVQNILDLEDGKSVLKLTIATYWRPSGKNIHRFKNAKESDEWGVSPDKGLEVKLTPKEHLEWALARQRRDMVAFGKKKPDAAAESPKKEAESKKDALKKNADQTRAQPATDKKADDKKADASKEKKLVNPVRDHSPKPFKDLVLEKAVSVLNGKMTEAASSAKAK